MSRRGWHLGIVGLGIAAWIGTLLAAVALGQTPTPNPSLANPPAAASPLDQAIAWLHEARRNYGAVKDYSCTLISRENIQGRLRDENIIQMKFRAAPFSVYMRWLAPSEFRGQEVAYVHGKNANKMRVHSKGILKIAGFVSVDPNDPRVMEHSRHTIYEAGMGHMVDQTLRNFETERQLNRTEVRIAEYDYNSRRCLRIENIRPERRPQYQAYRSVMYLDKESKLPVRTENYDWPRAGGPPTGELLEVYSYVDLRFNVGLADRDFTK
jgi:hypothetical protein